MSLETRAALPNNIDERLENGSSSLINTALAALRRSYIDDPDFPRIMACSKGIYDNGIWLRDAVDGVKGLLAYGNEKEMAFVGRFIEYCLQFPLPTPFRILDKPQWANTLGIKSRYRKPKGETEIPLSKRLINCDIFPRSTQPLVADSFLILQCVGAYLSCPRVNGDNRKTFWDKNEEKIKETLTYYQENLCNTDGLIEEVPMASRQDCILKSGTVFLTNLLWYQTQTDLAQAVEKLDHDWALALNRQSNDLRKKINQRFWPVGERDHYLDWIDNKKEAHDYFDTLANFWAIVLGVADKEKSLKILSRVAGNPGLFFNFFGLVEAVWPRYPKKLINRAHRLEGFTGYYNFGQVYWSEITLLYAAALKKVGWVDQASQALGAVESLLERDQTLYDVLPDLNLLPKRFVNCGSCQI